MNGGWHAEKHLLKNRFLISSIRHATRHLLESRISDRYLDFFGIKKIVMVAGLYDTVLLDGNGYDQDDIGSGGGAV